MEYFKITLNFENGRISSSDLKTLKSYLGQGLHEIKQRIAQQDDLLVCILRSSEFFKGVAEARELLAGLESDYRLFSNGEIVDLSFLDELITRIAGIELKSIR